MVYGTPPVGEGGGGALWYIFSWQAM